VIRVFFVLTNIRFVETIPGIVGVIRPVARELTCGMYAGIGNDTACVQNVMGRQEVAQMYGRCPEKRARSQLQDEEIYNVYVRCVCGGGGAGGKYTIIQTHARTRVISTPTCTKIHVHLHTLCAELQSYLCNIENMCSTSVLLFVACARCV
jgi:hypothetical protein